MRSEMSESIWDAFGVSSDEVSENPFHIPRDEYKVNVEAEIKSWKEGGPLYFVVNYVIMEGAYRGMGANRMFPLKPLTADDDPEFKSKNARTLSSLKKTLLELGLNADQIRMFRFTPEFARVITGIKGVAEIGPQKKGDFSSVYEFTKASTTAPSNVGNAVPVNAMADSAVSSQADNGPVSGSVGSLSNLADLFGGLGGQ